MSDVIQGLDVITKLLPQLKSFTGARRREYFETLIAPLFDSFEDVQEFYNDLILQTRHKVVELKSTAFSRKDKDFTIEQVASLRAIKEEFLRKRQQDEFLRDAMRQDAKQMFATITWSEERRFLASVAYYFLGRTAIAPSDRDLDRAIGAVIEQGG